MLPDLALQIYHFYRSLNQINEVSRTISSSKGQEFENVILNIDSNWAKRDWKKINFDLAETDALSKYDMMSYLMYVGASRAKKSLIIYVNISTEMEFLEKFCKHFSDIPIERLQFSDSDKMIWEQVTIN